jgi:hypothetical protein
MSRVLYTLLYHDCHWLLIKSFVTTVIGYQGRHNSDLESLRWNSHATELFAGRQTDTFVLQSLPDLYVEGTTFLRNVGNYLPVDTA